MNQMLSLEWEWHEPSGFVTIPFPVLGRIRVEAGQDDGAIARAIAALPKLLWACKAILKSESWAALEPELLGLLQEALVAAGYAGERECRVCGCSDKDCRLCVERTGEPCRWVEDDLCSACAEGR